MSSSEIEDEFPRICDLVEHDSNEQLSLILDKLDLHSPESRALVFVILRKFSKDNPRGYIKYACQLDPKSNLLVAPPLLEGVVKGDPVSVMDFIGDNLSGPSSSSSSIILANSLLRTLLIQMPESGIPLLSQIETPGRQELLSEGFRAWGARDIKAALAYLGKHDVSSAAKEMLDAAMEGAATSEPALAYSLARANSTDVSDESYRAIFSEWMAVDPGGATAAILELQPGELARYFLPQPSTIRDLCKNDAGAIKSILGKIPPNKDNLSLFQPAIYEYAATDPDGALNWVLHNSNAECKGPLLEMLARDWPMENQVSLAQALHSVTGEQKTMLLRGIASANVSAEEAEPLAFADHLSGRTQTAYVASVLEATLAKGCDDALKILKEDAIPGDALRDESVQLQIQRIASAYSNRSRADCQTWVESLSGATRVSAMTGLMMEWVKSDPVAAGEWIQGLAPDAARSAAIRCLVVEIESTDPATAAQWKEQLTD